MKKIARLPKTIKKTIRYILRDTDEKNLVEIERQLQEAIEKRKETLRKLKQEDLK
ncbi:2-oxo acid dehydrogenase subunit E2 [Paraliobacillus sediminis]|uniref:2-oxo acid dehydrogenase subunit E2 n=1 Tax=Paraliobacillus sediminis TaxID=1885916 RepID=UPI0013C3463E|nr:2-oxo acid dehydrogenase subunit E2 [Paraliobacillus sediminis]